MRALRIVAFRVVAVGTIAFLPTGAAAQERAGSAANKATDSLTTIYASRYYAADGFKQTLLGAGWRDVWGTPLAVPSLDLPAFAGGLKVLKRGGGQQSITLHLQEETGWKEWRFRSVNKFPVMNLPPVLRGTAVGRIIQDQVSAVFP